VTGERGWWVVQRVTGVLLAGSVGLHLWAQVGGLPDLTVRFLNDLLLLVLVVVHSIPGLRAIIYDHVADNGLRAWADRLLLLGGAGLVGYGAWGLWVFFT